MAREAQERRSGRSMAAAVTTAAARSLADLRFALRPPLRHARFLWSVAK